MREGVGRVRKELGKFRRDFIRVLISLDFI